MPSQLVERRPDVRAAEAQLHAATAQVGVATANLLPQFTITGDIGSSATAMQRSLQGGHGILELGANATQTLFAGGTLIHRKRAAEAALDQAAAMYKSAVLTAFQNVADALHALDTDADALNAAAAPRRGANVSGRRAASTGIGIGELSGAAQCEQTYQQAVVLLAQARANRYADTGGLSEALGGSITR